MIFTENRVKVAIVIDQLSYGGAERQVVELALGLQEQRDYEPVVICYSNLLDPFGTQLEKAGIQVMYPKKPLRGGLPRILWIRRALKRYSCEIAYAILNTPNIYCSLSCLGIKIKFVASIRGVPDLNWVLRMGLRVSFKIASRIIANSESGKIWAVKKYGVNPGKVIVVPNAVSKLSRCKDARNKLRQKLAIKSKDVVVGTIANLKAQKQPEFFMQVARLLIHKNKTKRNVHFIWVGDGPLKGDIEKRLDALPPEINEKVHFVGAKNNVEDWLSLFDIFIMTSDWEGLPNALMEAMSAGLPCIATDVLGTRDLVKNGYNGLLATNETGGFAEQLLHLISRNNLKKSLGQNAKAQMHAEFNRTLITKKTFEVFNEAISK